MYVDLRIYDGSIYKMMYKRTDGMDVSHRQR